MTCGPAIDRAENKALLSQLFYTGSFWDSIDSGWAMGVTEVAMLLTPPYISSLDSHPAVTQATAIPQIQPTFYAEIDSPVEFPPANIGVFGIAEPAQRWSVWRTSNRRGMGTCIHPISRACIRKTR